MNLIDKRELLNERPENLNPNMDDEIKSAYNKGWNSCNSEWISLITEQPTAYDIDEVVKQLKENYLYSIGELKMISLDDAISVIKLHSPERPVVIRTPMGSAIICPNCGETIYYSDMMCRNCTQVIDWGDEDDNN